MIILRQKNKRFQLPSTLWITVVCILLLFVSITEGTGNETDFHLQWARQAFSEQAGTEPFSFVYNDQLSRTFLSTWQRQIQEQVIDETKLRRTLTLTDPATALEVKAVVTIYTDTSGVDWTLYFTNNGPTDSLILEQILALDVTLDNESAESPVLHRLKGSTAAVDDWLPFDTSLSPNDSVEFGGVNGRASVNCPFFNLQWGNQGVITAVGWSGQWQARVQHLTNNNLLIRTGMQYLHLKLYPGENIRTPRIMQLYWFDDHLNSYNLFRRTMFNHILPRKQDGSLCVPPIAHLSTSFYELNDSNESNVLSHLSALSGLGFEVFWLDAYYTKGGFPNGMGNYGLPANEITPDPERFPNGLGPIRDAVHQEGMDFLLWFEPERVAGGTYIAENYPQYVISASSPTLGNADYYVIQNKNDLLFHQLDTAGDSTFDIMVTLQAGATIDFAVGAGPDGGSNDTTPLVVVITKENQAPSDNWNFAKDIKFTGNPNGPWSYGSCSKADDPTHPDTSSFQLYNDTYIQAPGIPWWHYNPKRTSEVPSIYQNTTAAPVYSCPPGMVALHPGTDAGEIAVARWIAPSDGLYHLTGTFYAGYTGEGSGGRGGLFNLGLPEARQYMTNYFISAIHEFGLGVLRFDYNLNPLPFWQSENQKDPDRVGICEIRYMEGLYQMWDEIRQAHPNLLIDDCASGGMRIDLETMSRAIPLWRTDGTISPLFSLNFNQAALQNQVMTSSLNRYIPFSTSGMMGATPYWFRSGVNGGGISFCEDVRPETYPRDLLARGITEAKRIRDYYLGNYHPLTEITTSASVWCVMQYHRPDKNDGMIVAFRRQNSPDSALICQPQEIDPNSRYQLNFYPTYDLAESILINGMDFRQLELKIDEIPGSLLIEYQKLLEGDVTGDGYVDMADLMLLVSQWLQCSDPANPICDP